MGDVTAVAAVGLSALSLYLQWRERRPDVRLRAAIELRPRRVSYDPTQDTMETVDTPAIVTTARNVGTLAVTFEEGWLRRPWNPRCGARVLSRYKLAPHTLAPNPAIELHACLDPLRPGGFFATAVPFVRLEMRDQLGRRWTTNYVCIPANDIAAHAPPAPRRVRFRAALQRDPKKAWRVT